MRLSYRSLALWISSTAASTASTAASAPRTTATAAFVSSSHSLAFQNRFNNNSSRPRGVLPGAFYTTATTTSAEFSKRRGSRFVSSSISRAASAASTDPNKMERSDQDGSTLRVALCQFPVSPDKAINHSSAAECIERAVSQGAQLIVLPEIWNGPYATAAFPEYAEILPNVGDNSDSSSFDAPSIQVLMEQAQKHNVWIIGGSISERDVKSGSGGGGDEKIYNTCVVLDPNGTVVAKHRKVHLFDIDVPGKITFFESDTLSPGQTVSHFTLPPPWKDVTIGVGICYDIRFAEYAMLLCQQYGCTLLVYPGAFNMTTGPAHWELLQRGRALDNQCYVLTVSPARVTEEQAAASGSTSKYPHYTAYGHSSVVSPWGEVIATTDEKPGLVVTDLDLTKIQEIRNSIPLIKQKRNDMYTVGLASGYNNKSK